MDAKTDLITLHEVAAVLGISYETAKKWRQKNIIPAPAVYVTRRHQRWDRAEIEKIGRCLQRVDRKNLERKK